MKLKITVHGIAYEVEVEVLDPGSGFPSAKSVQRMMPQSKAANGNDSIPKPAAKPEEVPSGSREGITSPIAGTVIEVKCSNGDDVTKGQVLVVMEAMKMKTSIAAPTDGNVKKVLVAAGDSVRENQMLIELT